MNNNNEVISQYKEAFPAFGSYMECMSRTFMTGLASFSLGNTCVINVTVSDSLKIFVKNLFIYLLLVTVVLCLVNGISPKTH